MSHFKPYPTYKESRIEWIGTVPEHWTVKPLKVIASCNDDVLPESTPSDAIIRYVDISSVSHDEGICNVESMNFSDAPSRARRLAKPGDIIVSTVRTYLKAVASVDDTHADCVYSTGFAILRARVNETAPEFLKWLALNDLFIQAVESHSEGLSYPAINASELINLKSAMPNLSEQRKIAAVVDRETIRVNALIAKKIKFIKLLQEKRQALITNAVTGGLESTAPRKDSGVEWIGKMPAHWSLVQLGKITNSRCDGPFGSGLKSEHYQDDGIRVIRLQNIGSDFFKNEDAAFISMKHWLEVLGGNHEVHPDDILIAGLGDENNTLGRACVAPADLGRAIVKADCYRFRLDTKLAMPEFVALSLSATAQAECGFMATGATRERLNLSLAASRKLALPPRAEQVEIVTTIKRDAGRIDNIIAKTQRSIDLLKERRSAFITAAVTGQIDLRNAS